MSGVSYYMTFGNGAVISASRKQNNTVMPERGGISLYHSGYGS